MQVILTATASNLYCVLGDFHMPTDTSVQDFVLVF